jgi:hypothetical protein
VNRCAEPTADAAYRAALARRLAALEEARRPRVAARVRADLLPAAPPPAPPAGAAPAAASPLAALLQSMRQRPAAADGADAGRAWARLSVHRELAQAAAARPDQAGPLNSHALALRTLQTLQHLAPGYLERLVVQLEALRWLQDARPRRR